MEPSVATRVAASARDQYGVVTYQQLLDAGLSRGAVRSAERMGWLVRVHQAVYAIGYVPRTRETTWIAGVLACGDGAVVSHRSAAALWRIRAGEARFADVSVPGDGGRKQPRIAVHRVQLPEADRAVHRGIPVTSVARTLADLSPLLSEDDLYLAIREAMYLRVFDLAAVTEVLSRRRARALRVIVEDLTYTDSALERDFRGLCRRHGIPQPEGQYRIAGSKVDFCWPAKRVVVETDGWRAHGTPAAFQQDRSKTNRLIVAGWRVLRFTYADIKRRPAATARTLSRALGD